MFNPKQKYIYACKADLMMNRGVFHYSISDRFRHLFCSDIIMCYLKSLRKQEYYLSMSGPIFKILSCLNNIHFQRLGIKLGISIPPNVVGFGCVIPHYGTIVIGSGNIIGDYCVLHTCTCITAGNKRIGDGFYLSTGAKVVHDISIPNNVSVGANSLVNKSVLNPNCMIAGIPAKFIKESEPWYIRDGNEYCRRVEACKRLKETLLVSSN